MDPFDEFARAVAADNPDKYAITDTNPTFYSNESQDSKKGKKKRKKKSRKEEREEYERDMLRRLERTKEEVEETRTEIESTDENVEVNRTNPRKVSDIHELTREEVEKARAEIEIIKIKEPHRQSQKTIPTQATILNAGIKIEDCYVIFGVDQHITCDELKEQFRKLSVKYNSSIGMLSRTKEENEIIGKVHTRINQAYSELAKTHQC